MPKDDILRAIVRIHHRASGQVAGTGFLVLDRSIFTCAHVIAAALDMKESTFAEAPAEPVPVTFPLSGPRERQTARVTCWRRPVEDPDHRGPEDIALLQLAESAPPGAAPAQLRIQPVRQHHHLSVYGFPQRDDRGRWADLRDQGQRSDQSRQMVTDPESPGQVVAPGYSGAPVVDRESGEVVGMVGRVKTDASLSWYIPTAILLDACPAARDAAALAIPAGTDGRDRLSPQVRLYGRRDDLHRLTSIREGHTYHVVSLVASSGVGKTALVSEWLKTLSPAGRTYTWKFSEPDPTSSKLKSLNSAADFLHTALKEWGDPNPELGSDWDKGERLAALLRKYQVLLVLDGLESLQVPHTAGYWKGASPAGDIVDQGILSLVLDLARDNTGLCVITTQLWIADLAAYAERSCQLYLDTITDPAGVALLKDQGIRGEDDQALIQICRDFGRNAFALKLLAAWLNRTANGDARQAEAIPALPHLEDEDGRHSRRVMAAWAEWFGQMSPDGSELQLLRLLSLFDGPADPLSLNALLADRSRPELNGGLPASTGDYRWRGLIECLRDYALIAPGSRTETVDIHPLVRLHFGASFQREKELWRFANGILFREHQTRCAEHPATIEALLFLYRTIRYGCEAGAFPEASGLYERVNKERIFTTRGHGFWAASLAMWASFFAEPYHGFHPELKGWDSWQTFVLSEVGWCFFAYGQGPQAIQPMERALEIAVRHKRWQEAAIISGNLCEVHAVTGGIGRGIAEAADCLRYAGKAARAKAGFEPHWHLRALVLNGHLNLLAGNLKAAGRHFHEARRMREAGGRPGGPLRGFFGYQYCNYLLEAGRHLEALNWAAAVQESWEGEARPDAPAGSPAVDRAMECLAVARVRGASDITRHGAREPLRRALDGLRLIGRQDLITEGLMAGVDLCLAGKDDAGAHEALKRAEAVIRRGGVGAMATYEADALLKCALLAGIEGDAQGAARCLGKAEFMIQSTGYRLRFRMVEQLKRQLADRP